MDAERRACQLREFQNNSFKWTFAQLQESTASLQKRMSRLEETSREHMQELE